MSLMITVFTILFCCFFQHSQAGTDCALHSQCDKEELCVAEACISITQIECCNEERSCDDREVCIKSETISLTNGRRNCTGEGRCVGCTGQIEQLIFLVHAADGRHAIDLDLSGNLEYYDAINLKGVTKWTAEKALHWNVNDSYCMYDYKWIQCNCLEESVPCEVSVHDADGEALNSYKNETGSEVRLKVRYSKPNHAYSVEGGGLKTESVYQLLCHRLNRQSAFANKTTISF